MSSFSLQRRQYLRLRLFGWLWKAALGVLAIRLVQLTWVEHPEFTERALRQHKRLIQLPPDRGGILDRNGELLATSIDMDSIFGAPREMDTSFSGVGRLASLLGLSQDYLVDRLNPQRSFVWLARHVSPEKAKEVFDGQLPGIGFVQESQRFYPRRHLAGQVLGFVNLDGKGLEGLEKAFDDVLEGKPGKILTEIDARRRQLATREQVLVPRTAGRTITLTLDATLQHIAESALLEAVEKEKARSGVAIVLDPYLGDVLAMATVPLFDPNKVGSSHARARRNRAISDVFEPGSTLKPFAVAGCLEEGLCQPGMYVDCKMGSLRVGGHTFKDHKSFGLLKLGEVLKHSSNIGAMQVALRLGPEKFYQTLRNFRFGSSLTSLPQESAGRLGEPKTWSRTTIAAMAMGYEMMLTPLQLASAYAAIANDGLMIQPRFILRPAELQPPNLLGRVLSASTARIVRSMLEEVVASGTGKAGQPKGYTAAGKTGTAKKYDPRLKGYSPTDVRATFAGMVPAEKPRLVIVVTLDRPQVNPWGGLAAAPVFGRIAERSMDYLESVSPDVQPVPRFPLVQNQKGDGEEEVDSEKSPRQRLDGLSLRESLRLAREQGVPITVQGQGYVHAVEEHKDGDELLWAITLTAEEGEE